MGEPHGASHDRGARPLRRDPRPPRGIAPTRSRRGTVRSRAVSRTGTAPCPRCFRGSRRGDGRLKQPPSPTPAPPLRRSASPLSSPRRCTPGSASGRWSVAAAASPATERLGRLARAPRRAHCQNKKQLVLMNRASARTRAFAHLLLVSLLSTSRPHRNPGGACPGGTYAYMSNSGSSSPPVLALDRPFRLSSSPGRAPPPRVTRVRSRSATSSSSKKRLSCRMSCFASQSPTPRRSPTNRRRALTPPNARHFSSGAASPGAAHKPHSANLALSNALRGVPEEPPSDAAGRARFSALRIASGAACSTPTLPALWCFVSRAAVVSCAPRKACRAPGTCCDSERSWRPASASVSDDATAGANRVGELPDHVRGNDMVASLVVVGTFEDGEAEGGMDGGANRADVVDPLHRNHRVVRRRPSSEAARGSGSDRRGSRGFARTRGFSVFFFAAFFFAAFFAAFFAGSAAAARRRR